MKEVQSGTVLDKFPCPECGSSNNLVVMLSIMNKVKSIWMVVVLVQVVKHIGRRKN